jgi:hypothetical protein
VDAELWRAISESKFEEMIGLGEDSRDPHKTWFKFLAHDAPKMRANTRKVEISAEKMGDEFSRGTLGRFEPLQMNIYFTGDVNLTCSAQRDIFERHCGRRFFTMKSGYMGLAEFSIESSDVVAVISGQQMPVVLRPKGTCFEFVSVAYIHGMMDGEAWPEREGDLDLIEII